MHTSACSSLRTVSLLGLLAVLGVLIVNPATSCADTIRQPLQFELAALPPQTRRPVERLGDPRTEPEPARPRRKPAGVQAASLTGF